MKIVFWQNVLSMHQEALLTELAKRVEVWLIYEEELYESRKAMGWYIPKFDGVRLVSIHGIHNHINSFLQNLDQDFHIFSGIDAYPNISKYFNIFYKIEASKIVCFLEKPGGNDTGLKSYLRFLKYKYYAIRYKHINYLFTPGGEEYFVNAGFKRGKVIPFGYFGPEAIIDFNHISPNNIVEFVYVGSLSKLKNVELVIHALRACQYTKWHMNIIGNGEEKESLMKLVDKFNLFDKITFLGQKSNNEVQDILCKSDYLILPSLYDGWGYVVNEAMSKGCSIICSDACGVSSVVKNCKGSYVFFSGSVENLNSILNQVVSNGPLGIVQKKATVDFFQENLSGYAGTKRLLDILK